MRLPRSAGPMRVLHLTSCYIHLSILCCQLLSYALGLFLFVSSSNRFTVMLPKDWFK